MVGHGGMGGPSESSAGVDLVPTWISKQQAGPPAGELRGTGGRSISKQSHRMSNIVGPTTDLSIFLPYLDSHLPSFLFISRRSRRGDPPETEK